MNKLFDRIAPETIIQLAEEVYLLDGVPDLVPDGDLVILYDPKEWEPASYTQCKPERLDETGLLCFIRLNRVNNDYNMVTHVCRTWLDMNPRNGKWWKQTPRVFRGEKLGILPLLTTVFPHRDAVKVESLISD